LKNLLPSFASFLDGGLFFFRLFFFFGNG